MADRLRRPTMNDVARAAGVSLKSVSRVINDEVGASPETRERVLRGRARARLPAQRRRARAAPLGRPVRVDRPGARGHRNPFAAALNRAVERVAGAQGSLVLAVSTNADPDREESPGLPAAGPRRWTRW